MKNGMFAVVLVLGFSSLTYAKMEVQSNTENEAAARKALEAAYKIVADDMAKKLDADVKAAAKAKTDAEVAEAVAEDAAITKNKNKDNKKKYRFNVPRNSISYHNNDNGFTGFKTFTHHANWWGVLHKGNATEATRDHYEKLAKMLNDSIAAYAKEKGVPVPVVYSVENAEYLGRVATGYSLTRITIRAEGVIGGCMESPVMQVVARVGYASHLDVTGEDLYRYFALKRHDNYASRLGPHEELLLPICTEKDFAIWAAGTAAKQAKK